MTNLTEKEQWLLAQVNEGMDTPGCGWLFELTAHGPYNEHQVAGIVGALIEKNLIATDQIEPGEDVWVVLVDQTNA
jgi:hypothetical protein